MKLKNLKRKIVRSLGVGLCGVMFITGNPCFIASAAARYGATYIDGSHGYLRGSLTGNYDTAEGKILCTAATTDKVVSKIRAYESVYITSTGKKVDSDNSYWQLSRSYAAAECDMIHADAKGYKNVTLTTYGTCDAIQKDAYVVSLSLQY